MNTFLKRNIRFLLKFSILTASPFLCSFDFAEHKKIGDEAFAILPYRMIEDGLAANFDSCRAVLDRLFRLESMDKSKYTKVLKELSMSPNEVTYGDLNALSGDHVSNPLLLETELQTRFSKTNRILALVTEEMRKFNSGAKPTDLLSVNPSYGAMAIKDLSHFLNYGRTLNEHIKMIDISLIEKLRETKNIDNVFEELELTNCLTKYFTLHYFSIYMAQEAGKAKRAGKTEEAEDMLYYALIYEAFAEHFLQDGFASGHMFVNRGFTASAVVNNKALHDFYNTVPTKSYNLKGDTWMALGDKRLNAAELNEGGYKYLRADKQQFGMYEGIPDSVYDITERKSQLLSYAVIATYTSMMEVWEANKKAFEGDDANIIAELRSNEKALDQYVFATSKVIYCIHIPYGSKREEMPVEALTDEVVKDFDETIQLPFSRGFIRSRVANSVMVILGVANGENVSIGGRINLSMINFNTANLGRKALSKGKVIHWVNPTISGFYSRNADFIVKNEADREYASYLKKMEGTDMQQYMWNLKGGVNYTCDIFLGERRFFSLFSYLEGGIDTRDKIFIDKNVIVEPDFSNFDEKYKSIAVTNATFVPTVGLQLGSLIGLHRFTLPSWIRIPLYIILPLKVSASCHMTHGMRPMWSFNSEIDILF